MRAFAVALAGVLLGLCAACSPAQSPRATVSLRLAGGPRNASVTIDDRFVGSFEVVAARGVALPPGTHRVTVEAAGHFPFDRIVEAQEGAGPVRLDVKLVPMPE